MNATRRSARIDLTDPEPDAAAMDGTRGHALATGVFFIAAAVAAIAGLVLYGPILQW